MAGTRISALAALTAVAADDVLPIVDVNDTTQAMSGTTKGTTVGDLVQSMSLTGVAGDEIVTVNPAAPVLPANLRSVNFPVVDLKADFGAVGDGVADDTAALAAFFADVTGNHKRGIMPEGDYLTSATIVIPSLRGWAVDGVFPTSHDGVNYVGTRIIGTTDNIPIIQLGDVGSLAGIGIRLANFGLTYSNVQPSTNTDANCIYVYGEIAYGAIKDIDFGRGFYGIKGRSGNWMPYSIEFGPFRFSGEMSGGAMDFTGAVGSGSNNKFRRMSLGCTAMVGPIFNNMKCFSTSWDVLEFVGASLGPRLFVGQAGCSTTFGEIKLENGSYTAAGVGLFEFQGNFRVRIGSFAVGGSSTVLTPSSGTLSCFLVGGGGFAQASYLKVGTMDLAATSLTGQVTAVAGGSTIGRTDIDNIYLANGWTLQNTGSSTAGNFITVRNWKNDMLSDNRGDAAYVVALGDPNINHFTTAFTASRNIDLPLSSGNNIHNGLYYEFIFDGAINGANTAVIRNNTTPLLTLTKDKVIVRYTWRRNVWVLTRYEPMPGADTGWTAFANLTSDKTLDANATTLDEVADVLGTLIELLKTKLPGIIST